MSHSHLAEIDGLIIDLDGTVFHGSRLIDGTAETIARLTALGKRIVYLSNRGNLSRREVCDRLNGLGVPAVPEQIVMSSTVTAGFMRRTYPGSPVWALGEQGLRDELEEAGVPLADRPEQADWLIVTLHESLTYRELNDAFRAVRGGARIIATNSDKTVPDASGAAAIDVAGMIGALTGAAGRLPDLVVGKPSWLMAEAALAALGGGVERGRCLVIGDSMESDIALGRLFGMKTALVLTGSTTREMAGVGKHKPDYVWESIADAVK